MVFLRDELVLENELIRKYSNKLRQLASLEFAIIFHKHKHRLDSIRYFGDEIEYIIVNLNHKLKLPQLLPIYPHIQSIIQSHVTVSPVTVLGQAESTSTEVTNANSTEVANSTNSTEDSTKDTGTIGASTVTEEKNPNGIAVVTKTGESGTFSEGSMSKDIKGSEGTSGTVDTDAVGPSTVTEELDWKKCIFTPEYGSYMVESIPDEPYKLSSNYIKDIRKSIKVRRRRLDMILRKLGFPNAKITTLTNFIRIGCKDCVYLGDEQFRQPLTGELEYKLSNFFPNICITPFSRFTEITHNIKLKNNSNILIPKFNTTNTLSHTTNILPHTTNVNNLKKEKEQEYDQNEYHMEKHMEKVHKIEYDMDKVMELGMDKVMEIGFEMEFYGLLSEKQRKLAYELLIQYGNNINFSNFNSSVTVTGPTTSTFVPGPTPSTVVPGSSMEDSTVPNTVTEENTSTTTKDIIKDNIEMTNDTLSNTSTSTDIITDITDNYITDNYTTDTVDMNNTIDINNTIDMNNTIDINTTVHMNDTIDMNNTINLNDEMKIYNYITQQVFLYDPQLYKSSVTGSGITVLGHTDSTTDSTSPTMSSSNNTKNSTTNNLTTTNTTSEDIGTIGASTVTEGKGANSMVMECTSTNGTGGKGAGEESRFGGTVGPSTVTDTVTEYIQMDSVGFGMGMACLQVTFGCINISEARYLHDQLIPLAPIFLSLSSATVGFRGELSNIDNRWPVLVQAMDDLDEHTRPYIIKGRYNTTSLYIQNSQFLIQNYLYLNDIQVASDSISYINLIKSGVDPILSRYISHELIYDPLIVYKEDFDSIDCNYTDMHYQVFHTTNWNTVRFNHPSVTVSPVTVLGQTASNGHDTNGHDSNGHDSNGTGSNGHDTNGPDSNGPDTNGPDSNNDSTVVPDTNSTEVTTATKASTNTSNNTTKASTNTSNTNSNKDIGTVGASTVTEGKGANSTLMECTMGKGANSTAMECTPGKGANFTAMECTPGKGANFTATECSSGKGANSMGTKCTKGTSSMGTVGNTEESPYGDKESPFGGGRGPHSVTEKNLPWRIEFRPMDIQMTDEENIMFISVLSYLVKVILKLKLNLYMPISLVDFNIQLASNIKSCYQQSFYFPKHINTFNQEIVMGKYNLYEILYGKIGLFCMVLEYLEEEYINELISNEFYNEMKLYLQHFKLLTLGKLPTNATKQRQFIISHPSYQHDGIIHHDILYDLINQFTCQ